MSSSLVNLILLLAFLGVVAFSILTKTHLILLDHLKMKVITWSFINAYGIGIDRHGLSGDNLLGFLKKNFILRHDIPTVLFLWQFKEINDRYSNVKLDWSKDYYIYMQEIRNLIPPRGNKYKSREEIWEDFSMPIIQEEHSDENPVSVVIYEFLQKNENHNPRGDGKTVTSKAMLTLKLAIEETRINNTEDISCTTSYLSYMKNKYPEQQFKYPTMQAISQYQGKISENTKGYKQLVNDINAKMTSYKKENEV